MQFVFVFFFALAVELVASALPEKYVEQTIEFVSRQVSASHHTEFYLEWATKILTIHALKDSVFRQQSLVLIQDSLQRKYDALSKVCDFNKYTLKVLKEMGKVQISGNDQECSESDSDDNENDFGDNTLMLIRQQANESDDHDVEMSSDSDSMEEH